MKHVEVWLLDRLVPGADPERLEALLTPEERKRRDRFRRAEDQDRFRLGRALSRTVLARRLGRPPASIGLEVGPVGRPTVADAPDGPWFSISHSGDLVVLAVAPTPEVGVDVEREDRALDVPRLAAKVCTPAERAVLAASSAADLTHRFCAMWTLKEAYAKATGLGLELDPAHLGFNPDLPGLVEQLGGLPPAEAAAWRFRLWRPVPGYSLALAFKPPAGDGLAVRGPLSAAALFKA